MRMIEERKLMQESIKQIDKLENKGVDEALAKRSVDGAPNSPKKTKKGKGSTTMNGFAADEDYRPSSDRFGW